ncbi:sulfite exporter TauE/SafE family protein [Massilia sp. W12]|uniref:urease accessory protein UreH domain-containing protein n=1 Tax=Massilia sp. W12 TaxID=3126507 RepID=UPI0030CE7B6B
MLNLSLLLAAAAAGLAGGLHCAGMCSPVLRLLQKQAPADIPGGGAQARVLWLQSAAAPAAGLLWQIKLHAGRLSLYMAAGGVAGLLGAGSLILQPDHAFARFWFLLSNLWLLLFAWRLLPGLLQPHTPRLAALLELPLQAGAALLQRLVSGARLAAVPARASQLFSQGRRHPFLLGLAWGCLPCGLLYLVLPLALLSASPLAGAVLLLVFGLCSLPHLLVLPGLMALRHPAARWLLTLALLALGGYGLLHADMQDMPAWMCVN